MAAHSLDDLRRVIRRIDTRRPKRPAALPIEEVLGGELVDTGEGQLLVVRREFPLSYRHGRQPLGAVLETPLDLLSAVARADTPIGDPRGLLFLDAETTGLAGGTGTYAFLIGAAWLEDDRLILAQHFMRDFDEEPALLAALRLLLERASAVVTFNGASFDLPLLETRFIMARRRWPAALPHLDLLRPSRRVWTSCFADCRLATLEREVIGVVRDDDIPGALIPALYFDFLRSRRAAPLGRVLAHNRDDILTLVGLLGWFGGALSARAEMTAAELGGLGRLWEPVDVERALDIHWFPEPPEPAQLRRGHLRSGGERSAEPAEQPHQREDVVPVVRQHAAERRRPTRAQKVEVERRDQGAGNVVVAHDTDHLALERRESAIGEARRPHSPRRAQEVEMGQRGRPAPTRHD